MKIALYAVLAVCLVPAGASPQSEDSVGSEPSPMEAFANMQGIRTTWSSEMARLENGAARLVITALVLEDNAQPPRKVRGVKIDLSGTHAQDRIYLDADATERTRAALEEIAEAAARSGVRENGCMGAREFWPLYNWPWNKYHELNAEVCGRAQSLVLSGRGTRTVVTFANETPLHLAGILARAYEQLKQH